MRWTKVFRKSVSRAELKKFGWLFTAVFLIISSALFYHERTSFIYFLLGSISFLISTLYFSILLKPVWQLWMVMAHVLGLISTALLLSLFYMVGISLVALLFRFFSTKPQSWAVRRDQHSYWKLRKLEINKKERMETQF